jgi:hypothetical protein
MAICPSCKNSFSYVNLTPVNVKAKGASWHGVAYCCPSCDCALSVAVDPVAIKSDIVSEILDALGKD